MAFGNTSAQEKAEKEMLQRTINSFSESFEATNGGAGPRDADVSASGIPTGEPRHEKLCVMELHRARFNRLLQPLPTLSPRARKLDDWRHNKVQRNVPNFPHGR